MNFMPVFISLFFASIIYIYGDIFTKYSVFEGGTPWLAMLVVIIPGILLSFSQKTKEDSPASFHE